MNPDVVAAIDRLRGEGVLTDETASRLRPVAAGELVSVRTELRVLLYAGVLLVMAGVGELVRLNLDRLGPVAVAAGLAAATAACLGYVVAKGPAYSPGPVEPSSFAFDYVLLLGALLFGSTLAYLEVQFTPLGAGWPWHFLILAAASSALAFRYDSRTLFSVALASMAAWRGVSVSLSGLHQALPGGAPETLRWNALACGVVFALLGWALARGTVKTHFEAVATHLGVLLVLGALLSGSGPRRPSELLYAWALLVVGAAVAAFGAGRRRFPLVTLGTLAAYAALVVLVIHLEPPAELGLLLLALSALGLLAGLLAARRRLREEDA